MGAIAWHANRTYADGAVLLELGASCGVLTAGTMLVARLLSPLKEDARSDPAAASMSCGGTVGLIAPVLGGLRANLAALIVLLFRHRLACLRLRHQLGG
jgi:hypothetical protein